MQSVVFRAGPFLLAGRIVESAPPIYTVELRYRLGPPVRLGGVLMKVHERFVLKRYEAVSALEEAIGAKGVSQSWTRQVWEDIRKGLGGIHYTFGGRLSEGASLEAGRPRLKHLGFVQEGIPVLAAHGECRAFHAYMKTDPFRDITKVPEGVFCVVTGYHKGCALVEADGEEFWVPCEALTFIDSKTKDDQYFQDQDYDKNKLPDPLTSLPSKDQLQGPAPGAKTTSPADNWNCYPQQSKIAGNLYPLQDIDMDDVSILKGDLPKPSKYTSGGIREASGPTTAEYFYFYQQHKPGLHGISGPVLQDLVDALVAGAPVEPMFIQSQDYDELEKAYIEAFKAVFPGDTPDLPRLKRLFNLPV